MPKFPRLGSTYECNKSLQLFKKSTCLGNSKFNFSRGLLLKLNRKVPILSSSEFGEYSLELIPLSLEDITKELD